jgi:hypothetical protein
MACSALMIVAGTGSPLPELKVILRLLTNAML